MRYVLWGFGTFTNSSASDATALWRYTNLFIIIIIIIITKGRFNTKITCRVTLALVNTKFERFIDLLLNL